VRYDRRVYKIIREILILLWKAIRLLFWNWFKPIVRRLLFYTALLLGLFALLVYIATRI
jgi:hypothetical protein